MKNTNTTKANATSVATSNASTKAAKATKKPSNKATAKATIKPEAEAPATTPQAPAKEEAKAPALVIISAQYGKDDNRIEIKDRIKPNRKLTNKMAGQDPLPRVIKDCIIVAEVHGKRQDFLFVEGEKLKFE